MTTTYYTATSLDGFIADPDNSLSWLLTRDVDGGGPMGYDGFFADVGAMAMGATTYAWVCDNIDGPWPYEIPCWVFTHRNLPLRDGGNLRLTQEPVTAVHAQMSAAAKGRTIWLVGGGDLVGQFADAGLLDEIWLQYAPVTLGGGAPVLPRRVELRLVELAQNGELACSRYAVVR